MIPLSALKDLFTVLPNSYITKPIHKNSWTGNKEATTVSWILDRDGERIGSINWEAATVTIFDSYEYSEEVAEAIGKDKFSRMKSDFNGDEFEVPESPIAFKDGEPTLTEQGKMLYEKPSTRSDR